MAKAKEKAPQEENQSSRGKNLSLFSLLTCLAAVGVALFLQFDDATSAPEQTEQREPVSVQVVLDNQWAQGAVSVYWEAQEDDWTLVSPSLVGPMELSTYIGHRFMFTQEGTRSQVGDVIEITPDTTVYVLAADAVREAAEACSDRYKKRCPKHAQEGECERNPGWMIVNCPKSCDACDLLDPKKRCKRSFLNITEEHVWGPGDLNRMFERIIQLEEFSPEVLSRPPEGPWIVVFNDFVKSDEIEALLNWGKKFGYQRSSDTGATNERGESQKVISETRTSSNAWCIGECESDPLVEKVSERTKQVTGIPTDNYESFQLLEYEPGEYYKVHHDMSERSAMEPQGPRILTFFLYLSDVEHGGETHFPDVMGGIKVVPKKGSAVLWPSVLDQNPLKQDARTRHAALPVERGLKYSANHWIHSHNFRKANLWGCTGAFD